VQTSHAPLHFGGTDVLNLIPLFVLDEDAREETNKIRAMQENIRLLERHAVIDSPRQMLHPHPILTTHVLFLTAFLLFASEQQTLCKKISKHAQAIRMKHVLAVIFLFSRSTSSWKPKTRISGGFSG
jgi:hypothetical protein